ncbi:MAG: PAS domain-containing protein [Chitinophagaceae bacterium]|nr:PAS domain-containing protein [Chitinophagaceae bacterium]
MRKVPITNFEQYFTQELVATWSWDLVNDEYFYGLGFEILFGYSQDFLAKNKVAITTLICVDDIERVLQNLEHTFKQCRSTWKINYHFYKANGEYALVKNSAYILYNQQKEVIKLFGTIKEISV